MSELKQRVRRARRRMIAGQFLTSLTWCLFGTLLIALPAVGLPKIMFVDVDTLQWTRQWLGGAVIGAFLAAAVWTYLRRYNDLDAAIAIDRHHGLKERIASSLSLSETDAKTPAGKALIADAANRIATIDVRDGFRLRLHRRAWLPLLPAVMAFCLVMLVDDRGADNPAAADTSADSQRVKNSNKALQKKIAERRKKAEEQGLKDAANLFKKLEEGTRELEQRKDIDNKQALVKMNDLARQLEKRRKELGGDDELKKQFKKLKDLTKGPADKFGEAIKNGNLGKAISELQSLKKQIEDGKLSPEQQKKLAEQLQQMQEKLQATVDAHRQAMKDLEKQIEKAKNAGNNAEASKLQQQLDRMAVKMPQIDKLDKLAQKLGNCASCMKQGDGNGAAGAMGRMAADLDGMMQTMEEMSLITDLESQINQAKDAMGCKQCNGQGCQGCQGGGYGDKFSEKPGNGLGAGRGFGDRPETEDNVGFRDSQVRQNVGKGSAVVTGQVGGPNVKDQVFESNQAEIEAFKQRDDDPLTDQRLPRAQRSHALEYFDTFRRGG